MANEGKKSMRGGYVQIYLSNKSAINNTIDGYFIDNK